MRDLYIDEPRKRVLFLGNEAIVRGAIEAGVGVATTYPGTPASEIGDRLTKVAKEAGLYFEYSTNEKVALEVALGAAACGVRAMCSMKHVGLNVAADAFMTLPYMGVKGGLVVVCADDPGCHSSQNEQDTRYYSRLAKVPMLEPSSVAEMHEMAREAFELSEELELPVLLRTTTRVNHARAIVEVGERRPIKNTGHFERDPRRWVPVPAVARMRHPVLEEQYKKAADKASRSRFNRLEKGGRLGVVTSGVSYAHLRDAMVLLGIEPGELSILKLGFTNPLPRAACAELLNGVDRVLVLEELEPFLEEQLRALSAELGLEVEVLGKQSGHTSLVGELDIDSVASALGALTEKQRESSTPPEGPALPVRPPILCAGCPHRHTYFAAKVVTHNEVVFPSDIGCYTLGLAKPLETADIFSCMGSSTGIASGMSRATEQPLVAFVGDSTFFHSGIPGLIGAVHNRHKLVLVVLDNRATAMTGHQPHPGINRDGMGDDAPTVSVEDVVRSIGVPNVEVVDPNNVRSTIEAFERALANDELTVIISRAPCILLEKKDDRRVYAVDQSVCKSCNHCDDSKTCSGSVLPSYELRRSEQKLKGLPRELKLPVRSLLPKAERAPCTEACPVNICVQGYVTQVAAGNFGEAMRIVRDQVPLAAVLGRVCNRPCEDVCERQHFDEPVNIMVLKRFAAEHETKEQREGWLRETLSKIEENGKKVAVVGSGPAGLACAYDLRRRGYQVTVFEALSERGGMLSVGIPSYRLPRDVLERELDLLERLGVEFETGVRIGRERTLDELRAQGYGAFFLAIGAHAGIRLGIEGEDEPGVHDALDFLHAVNSGTQVSIGKQVVVIGGGDAAFDAARTARRLGASQCTILYRRSREEMPAQIEIVRRAEAEGINLHLLAVAEKAAHDGERLRVQCQRMRLGEPDPSGRRRPEPIPGDTFEIPCDNLLVAIGETCDLTPFESVLPLGKRIEADATDGATSLEGVFSGGDAVTGPRTVVEAMAAGKRAAWGIDRYLRGEVATPLRMLEPLPPRTSETFTFRDVDLTVRSASTIRPAEERNDNFQEVDLGFTEDQARAEAARCLGCSTCAKCDACLSNFACPALYREHGRVYIDESLCNGCGVCVELCPNNAIVEVST